ncbi:MAG TPA: tRNA (guanosine(37)-N1)-methyltransferase TrmD [Nitrospirota bacterium]|jgi:tRNA (guanine37-N1)-methyltransferase
MKCEVLTLFPGIVQAAVSDSILGKAMEKGLLEVKLTDLREYARDKHKTADDYPFGGGPGMVMKPGLVFEAVDAVKAAGEPVKVLLMSPQGAVFDHKKALELSKETRKLVFICGRYEGIDERVRIELVDEEISIGDFVLSGGELAAAVIIEASARLIPGVLGDSESAELDSFYEGLLDYPHYTRPAEYNGLKVPDVLLSGHHEEIRKWRRRMALSATLNKRPELLDLVELSKEDKKLLAQLQSEKE